MIHKTELTSMDNWKFKERASQEWLDAKVPGCVHHDLLLNKRVKDPFYRDNEKDLQWIGKTDWEYQLDFTVSGKYLDKQVVRLIFQGLDTYASVYLNDELILRSENMFHTNICNVKEVLKEGNNILHIKFDSPYKIIMPKIKQAPYELLAFQSNDQADEKLSVWSRKAGFHYGWDWGPRLITCGVWKPVVLEAYNEAKLEDVYIEQADVTTDKAKLNTHFEISSEVNKQAVIRLKINDNSRHAISKEISLTPGTKVISEEIEIDNPALWWPNGLGDQPMYQFTAELLIDGKSVNEKKILTGLRDVKVIREDDEYGKSFYVKVNDVPVYIKGANYIPQDNFQSRVSDEDYEYIIKSAADVNMNMLRVWGGGIYQEDVFYELCDKYGILVWQDFMFACGMFPSSEEYYQSVQKEVVDNVKRIRNHACLALYCGNNENDIVYYGWGMKEDTPPKYHEEYERTLEKLFHEVIPGALATVDTTRYYHPTSPNTGYSDIPLSMGDVHYWGVWHGEEPFEEFNNNVGRFMSEYGFQSYPDIESVKKFTVKEDRDVFSDVMVSHQRCRGKTGKDFEYGNRLIDVYLKRHFKEPKDFASYLYLSQLLQSHAMKIAVEAHRKKKPFCMGTLYWQINDCWPAASWSSIDYYGQWKATHYHLKTLYNDLLIVPELEDGTLAVSVISDLQKPLENAQLNLQLMDFEGKVLWENNTSHHIAANSSAVAWKHNMQNALHDVDVNNGKNMASNHFYFVPLKELALPKASIEYEITEQGGKKFIGISADKYAKYVQVLVKNQDVHLSDNYFDLMPGAKKRVAIDNSDKPVSKDDVEVISLVDAYK